MQNITSGFSKKIGKSRQTVSDIERKSAPLGWDTFLAIIYVLKVYKIQDEILSSNQFGELLSNEILN